MRSPCATRHRGAREGITGSGAGLGSPRGSDIVTLAHISDLHATPVEPRGLAPLLGKRASGWLSWKVRRRHAHRPHVLEALIEDLHREAPDHVAITGDLTNIALEEEFAHARTWLERIGGPDWVTAVPGNHDAYVRVSRERSWDLWSDYLVSDAAGDALLRDLLDRPGPPGLEFPTLRLRGDIALVGLSSARPTPLFFASGSLGRAQRVRLERLLVALGERGLVRVLLLHHSPVPGAVSRRRALWDATPLCDLIRRVGAELVLHGHLHRTRWARIPGPEGDVPVIGVRSASDVGERPGRRAQYHLYDIQSQPGGGAPQIDIRTRGYDEASGAFRSEASPAPPAR